MAETEPLEFSGVTAAQYARLIDRAKAAGIEISGNSGTAQKFGATIAYHYEPEAQHLRLECTKTPFFMKTSDVYARLRLLVNES